jgi:hypothetical protein
MLPAFTFEARPVVHVTDAIRMELEAMAYRDGLKSKGAGPNIRPNALTILLIVAKEHQVSLATVGHTSDPDRKSVVSWVLGGFVGNSDITPFGLCPVDPEKRPFVSKPR